MLACRPHSRLCPGHFLFCSCLHIALQYCILYIVQHSLIPLPFPLAVYKKQNGMNQQQSQWEGLAQQHTFAPNSEFAATVPRVRALSASNCLISAWFKSGKEIVSKKPHKQALHASHTRKPYKQAIQAQFGMASAMVPTALLHPRVRESEGNRGKL